MKDKKRHIIRIIIFVILAGVIAFPSIRAEMNKISHKSLIDKVQEQALSGNIMIMTESRKSDGTSYSPSGSGVIFDQIGDKYFALTAHHVIAEAATSVDAALRVLTYDALTINDFMKSSQYTGLSTYYEQVSAGTIEYYNEQYDLAVISFDSADLCSVIPISNTEPKYGDVVVTISNPEGERNAISAGKIISRKEKLFKFKGEHIQYPVIKHSAVISEGSSGSAVLNEDLEIIAINLGGNVNLLRQHIKGVAMPLDRIKTFLNEWEENK